VYEVGVALDDPASGRYFLAQLAPGADALGASLGHVVRARADATTAEPLSVGVWLDERGRIIRINESWDVTTASGAVVAETVDVVLDRFGSAVNPQAPTGPTSTLTAGQMFVVADLR
jgi:hypothetical protein